MDFMVWSTDPRTAIRVLKAQKADRIVREYGGSVRIIWAANRLEFDLPKEISQEDEFECVARVTAMMEEDESIQGNIQLARRSPCTAYEG